MAKTFVIGIDGAPPEYVFSEWIDELPNIKKLMKEGVYAKLNSTIPPLSAIAWAAITTGKPPADLGIFEYVYRKNYSYNDVHIITAENIKEKTIWQIISEQGKNPIICFICLTWPIKPFKGCLINGPIAPSGKNIQFTYPKELKNELEEHLGEISAPDISDFRNLSKEEIIGDVYKKTEKHIDIMKYLMKNKDWDLFFGVINMSDRLHHMFWRYTDKRHRKYDPNSKFKNTLKEYYKFVDNKLGELIELLDRNTTLIVLSDHGITRMQTRVNLTDWLIKEGYLILKEPIKEKREFNFDMVDWKKTKAFAIGAYEGQIFINLKGREPQGIVEKEEYEKLIDKLEEKLKQIKGDRGETLNTKVFKKKDYFKGKCEDIAPDIIIYFDDLQYGCNTTLAGNETLYSEQTARGSDDAAHSRQGIFIMKNDKLQGNLGEIDILDVAPTILNELGLKIPEDMKGNVIGLKT